MKFTFVLVIYCNCKKFAIVAGSEFEVMFVNAMTTFIIYSVNVSNLGEIYVYGGGTELWKWKLNDTIVYVWFHKPVSLYRENVYVTPLHTFDAHRFGGGGGQNCTHTEEMI